jgi:hypothetical protein
MISSALCRFLAISPSSIGPKRTYVPDHSKGGGSVEFADGEVPSPEIAAKLSAALEKLGIGFA